MKIVDRATFLAMPEGTVFMKFAPCIFGALEIKTRSYQIEPSSSPHFVGDYRSTDLSHPCFTDGGSDEEWEATDRLEAGEEMPVAEWLNTRDGLYDADQLFAVLDEADVKTVIQELTDALVLVEGSK